MIEFKRLLSERDCFFQEAMRIYESSFPACERRGLSDQLLALRDTRYHCDVVLEHDKLVGIFFYWQLGWMIYAEHLAISPQLRGKRYGSKILRAFCAKHKELILEIETPKDAISIRRLHFYTRLGFKLQPFDHFQLNYRGDKQGLRMKIMTYGRNWTRQEYDDFFRRLQGTLQEESAS